ncbi:hypothetical protein HOLleu_43148 [Holothuria leucospilota]|uniref:Uncharacterized protein n=1 Tax=Holothuria leucospilota TaxID=206669 RepID=A0A9Q0Y9R8_HOLLE|nr:hypothetical protein HOLleu_43148 [Holothuria leucospilota]
MEVRRINSIKKSVQELSRGFFTPISLSVQDRFGHTVEIEIEQPKDQNRKNNLEDLIDRLIYIRDTQNISRRAYQELTMHCQTLPKEYRLRIRKQEINSKYKIHDLEKYVGVWQSFRETLSCRLSVLLSETFMRDMILHDGVVRIKITGDGTTIGKRIHITNIAFSIIGEPSCTGSSGSYLLAIVRVPEKQASLADALSSLISEINSIDSVSAGEESVRVQLYLAGDLKFLNQMMGVEGFNAKHCCLWCICPSELRFDSEKVWCMYNVERGARTVENITKNSSKKGKERLNCFSPPLFPSIPVSHVVPDILHLFLRISDQLVNHLLVELKALDNLRKCTSGFVITKYTHVQKFESFIQSLGVPWQFYLDKSSKLITSRDFTGPEHLKIFQNIALVDFIPNHPKLRKLRSSGKILCY